MRYLLLAIMTTGCVDFYDLQDRATPTAETCGLYADGDMGTDAFLNFEPSPECRDRILSDFRVEHLPEHSEQALFNGAWSLMAYNWGEIDDPSFAPYLDETVNQLGEQPNGFTMYNWVTAQFHGTIHEHDEDSAAAYRPLTDQLIMDDYLTPLDGAISLIHEAHHAEGSDHVRCPDTGKRQCDRGEMGAYSASIALLAAAPSVDHYVDTVIENTINHYQGKIIK